ncbi:DUF4219 domain-containing protein/UBN2 domain-containing protein [Cucumis melo var. makuwa]|uniref:DUF4219 domain-containing protein/UBN2 domain-containing protein n=1 Tax=Cucumis melo var. makuwa TaxID=1194695 RepID=A0A5A7TMU3_CUCMM|nr:DUF4219 domain-containing protein/UBN2 domain-containing protein [Cucumis melo var. makuwa]
MQAYMEGCDYWKTIEQDYKIAPLYDNPTLNQIKTHKERITMKANARAYLYVVVYSTIFNRLMALESAKEIWKFLKNKLIGIANKARALGTDLSDSRLVQKILVSVPE